MLLGEEYPLREAVALDAEGVVGTVLQVPGTHRDHEEVAGCETVLELVGHPVVADHERAVDLGTAGADLLVDDPGGGAAVALHHEPGHNAVDAAVVAFPGAHEVAPEVLLLEHAHVHEADLVLDGVAGVDLAAHPPVQVQELAAGVDVLLHLTQTERAAAKVGILSHLLR